MELFYYLKAILGLNENCKKTTCNRLYSKKKPVNKNKPLSPSAARQKREATDFDVWNSRTELSLHLWGNPNLLSLCSFFLTNMLLCAPACLLCGCELCVNVLIQAAPQMHSSPARLRSGWLIILAAGLLVGPAALKRWYHSWVSVIQPAFLTNGACLINVHVVMRVLLSQQQSGVTSSD